jgi:hypothetical protein
VSGQFSLAAGGSFFPEDYDFAGAERSEGGQPWTATTWTLNTLREWGLDASALRERRTAELLDEQPLGLRRLVLLVG